MGLLHFHRTQRPYRSQFGRNWGRFSQDGSREENLKSHTHRCLLSEVTLCLPPACPPTNLPAESPSSRVRVWLQDGALASRVWCSGKGVSLFSTFPGFNSQTTSTTERARHKALLQQLKQFCKPSRLTDSWGEKRHAVVSRSRSTRHRIPEISCLFSLGTDPCRF